MNSYCTLIFTLLFTLNLSAQKAEEMKTIILSLTTGISLGVIFAFLKLPIPAPNTISGLFGIIGIFVGYMVMNHFYNS